MANSGGGGGSSSGGSGQEQQKLKEGFVRIQPLIVAVLKEYSQIHSSLQNSISEIKKYSGPGRNMPKDKVSPLLQDCLKQVQNFEKLNRKINGLLSDTRAVLHDLNKMKRPDDETLSWRWYCC